MLTTINGGNLTLPNALFAPGIKKNLLSVAIFTKVGFVVKFVDDRCTIHDLSHGDNQGVHP